MRIIRKGWAILTVSMFLFAGLINTNSSPAGQVQKDSVVAVVAGANGLPWVSADKLPPHGTFWLVMNEGSFLLPMPFRPDDLKSAPAFLLSDDGSFLVDATGGILPQPTKRQAAHGVTSADLVKAQAQAIQDLIAQVQEARLNTELGALPGVKGGMQRMAMGLMGMGYGADDLWLEVLQVDMTNQFADLRLHGTVDTNQYQLLYTNNLAVPGNQWTLGAIKYGDYGTNQTDYPNVLIGTNSQMFYRAHQASAVLYLSAGQNAVEPRGTDPGQPGMVYIGGSGLTNDLAVYYRASGDAQGGIDYSNLSGVITLTNAFGSGFAEINVQPMADNLLEGAEKLTLTLVQTNQYLISPNSSSATIFVEDSSTTVIIYPVGDAVEPNGPPGIPAQSGYFALDRYDERGIYTNSLDVLYRVSGTASNGVDYTFLTGLFHFAPGISLTNMEVSPLTDNLTEGLETVTVTLIPTNTYLTNTNYLSAEVTIVDTTTTITLSAIDSDAVEPNGPPGVPAKLALFTVSRTDSRGLYTNALNVFYQISGTASNGVDYALLTGVLHFVGGKSHPSR